MVLRSLAFLSALLATPSPARAWQPLEVLPAEKLKAMTTLLRHGDVTLIESTPDGRLKQVTLLALVAAPSKLVHDVVADVARYAEFVHRMSKNVVTRNADGSFDQDWQIDYTVAEFDSVSRTICLPDGDILVKNVDPNDLSNYHWQFLEVPHGTVMVMYGYSHVTRSSSLVRSLIASSPTLEHGLALSAQLVYVRSIKERAEKLAGPPSFPPGDPLVKSPGFGFLLDRGKVAVIRVQPSGRLQDISVLDRIYAPLAKVDSVIFTPAVYSQFMEGVAESHELARAPMSVRYKAEVTLPHISWDTRYLMQRDGKGAIDIVGTEGDLAPSHSRWDLASTGSKSTMAILRTSQNLAQSSLVLRLLFQQEPIFEQGIAVALGLVTMQGVRGRSEGWK